jgi:hypothetical protein
MIDISPVPKTQEIAKIELDIQQFVLDAKDMDVCVTMYTADDKFVGRKMVHIPEDVYAAWGQDDSHIVDYVLSQIGASRTISIGTSGSS